MSKAATLAEAILALVPDVPGVPIEEGRATTPAEAWYIIDQQLPNPTSRSESGAVQSLRCAVAVRVVHQTAHGCRTLMDLLVAALEGARPVATGWQTTPLRQIDSREPLEDPETVVPPTAATPLVAAVDFEFTATALP
jgi:hypothetical protein